MMDKVTPDHDRHLATVALTARLGESPRPLSPVTFWKLVERLEGDPTRAADVDDEDVRALADRRTSAALHLSELQGQAITVLTPFHEHYPARFLQRLEQHAPPLLYAAGDTITAAASSKGSIGIVGSRHATDDELAFADDVGRACAAAGYHAISGGAKGVDAAGLNAAWTGGGFVCAVLAEGVRRAIRRRGLRQIITDGEGAIMSAVHPDAGFSVGAAMGRNKLLYAAADVTVVAAVEEGGGGTWNGAVEALKRGYGHVAVRRGARAAQALVDIGAIDIDAADQLREVMERSAQAPPSAVSEREAQQDRLF